VVINNDGYTVERVIHGPAKIHNDIATWDYQLMLQFFGASSRSKSYSARTYAELATILEDKDFQLSEQIQLLECFLDKYDSPLLLSTLVDKGGIRGAAALRQEDLHYNRSRVQLDGTLTQSGLSPPAGV
jgi:pyruvate decarboxylase